MPAEERGGLIAEVERLQSLQSKFWADVDARRDRTQARDLQNTTANEAIRAAEEQRTQAQEAIGIARVREKEAAEIAGRRERTRNQFRAASFGAGCVMLIAGSGLFAPLSVPLVVLGGFLATIGVYHLAPKMIRENIAKVLGTAAGGAPEGE